MLTLVPRQPPTRRLASLRASPSALSVSPRLSHSENGGTILAVAGENFTVIAGDTRQSEGYSIQTRYAPKVFRLSVSSTGVLMLVYCLLYLWAMLGLYTNVHCSLPLRKAR